MKTSSGMPDEFLQFILKMVKKNGKKNGKKKKKAFFSIFLLIFMCKILSYLYFIGNGIATTEM